jgi:hypothetical protein
MRFNLYTLAFFFIVLSSRASAGDVVLADIYSSDYWIDDFADPFDPIEFALTVTHPTAGERTSVGDFDEFDIGLTLDVTQIPLAWFENPEVDFEVTFDGEGFGGILIDILYNDHPDFDVDWFEPGAGIGLLGYTITDVEATILEACRDCDVIGDAAAEWVISIYGEGVPGDYNGNGKVDMADYVVWRKMFQRGFAEVEDYQFWRRSFGRTTPLGSAVPEPATWLLALLALPLMRRRG